MYGQKMGRVKQPVLPIPTKYGSLSSHFIQNLQRTKLGLTIDWGAPIDYPNIFDYKLNATICKDGTVCPNNHFSSSNWTCCEKDQGIQEINYHNNAVLPSAAADLPGKTSELNHTHLAPPRSY